jgi:hypothetical protein
MKTGILTLQFMNAGIAEKEGNESLIAELDVSPSPPGRGLG